MAYENPLIEEFLRLDPIAVVGASRSKTKPGRAIYEKFKAAGRKVYPVNPSASEIGGDRCYPTLAELPEAPEGVMVTTNPSLCSAIVAECHARGVNMIWMHRSLGSGSVSAEAAREARERGIKVIEGGCPMMFFEPVDFPHKCIRFIARITGNLP
jgi:predicted CoA-binding protein